MKIETAKQYNDRKNIKYSNDCHNWQPDSGGFPQAAFYFFSDRNGNFRKTGYVASDDCRAVWRKTKKEAIAEFLK